MNILTLHHVRFGPHKCSILTFRETSRKEGPSIYNYGSAQSAIKFNETEEAIFDQLYVHFESFLMPIWDYSDVHGLNHHNLHHRHSHFQF